MTHLGGDKNLPLPSCGEVKSIRRPADRRRFCESPRAAPCSRSVQLGVGIGSWAVAAFAIRPGCVP
jgi:hypothetical protein